MNDFTDNWDLSIGELISIGIKHQESLVERFPLIHGVKIDRVIEIRLGDDHVQIVFTHSGNNQCNTEVDNEAYVRWAQGVI